MKKTFVTALLLAIVVGANAQEKEDSVEQSPTKPVFTTVNEIPITSIKDQNRSGTCWNFSTLSYFECEILKKSNKTYDLCEAFVCNKDYMDRAVAYVRQHGDMQFAQGGSAYDVLYILEHYGICPEEAMPAPGTPQGDSLFNFNELFSILTPYVEAVGKNKAKKISPLWKKGVQSILDAYLGECPTTFTYEGKSYTPKTFAASLELDWNDYVSITSYTHHPFWTAFPVEVQDNWRQPDSWNVPLDDMMHIIDNAIKQGYTVAWGGDVSEQGFTRSGLALAIDKKAVPNLEGSDAAKWLKLTATEKNQKLDSLGIKAPEVVPTQEMRQERFDDWELTDDHGMLIYGIATDQYGKEYYMVKNSWGDSGKYNGIWYMTKAFIAQNTMDFLVNKNAIPKDIRKKLGI